MRKLASIRRVTSISSIEGADFIEIATVSGWNVVVKKGDFNIGDLGMYFEIDSFVPTKQAPFAFLEKNAREWNGKTGAIIRTMKLKGQISQGLLLPLHPHFESYQYFNVWGVPLFRLSEDHLLGMDFTKELGIEKYEKEIEEREVEGFHGLLIKYLPRSVRKVVYAVVNVFLPSKKKLGRTKGAGSFPSFIPKTDEERIQNIFSKVVTQFKGTYRASVKLDGSSSTFWVKDNEFGLASRNVKLGITDGSNFSKVALKYKLPEILPMLEANLALQCELMGPGIQGNREGLEDHDIFLFKIWDIDNKRYLNFLERKEILARLRFFGCDLKTCPDLGLVNTDDFPTVESFLKHAEGKSLNHPAREGVVYEKEDGNFSFKAISNQYLLKQKD